MIKTTVKVDGMMCGMCESHINDAIRRELRRGGQVYYLHNREDVSVYLREWIEFGRQMRESQAQNPPPFVARLRTLKSAMSIGET